MIRKQFNQDLEHLQDELLILGSMASHALTHSVNVLMRLDQQQAKVLIENDRIINAKKYQIEETCLKLIATQQPLARDLRLVTGAIELSTELERIGDYAKGIGKITRYLGPNPQVSPPAQLPTMRDTVVSMLRRALDAFVDQDLQTARTLPLQDDEVDDLYNEINHQMLQFIVKQPSSMDQVNYIIWAAHNLERAGDRVTNICERTIYTITGEFVEMDETVYDMSAVA
ncbi:MAG: phosphate signaling complex protein PhoU [Chloroflexota bacterium]